MKSDAKQYANDIIKRMTTAQKKAKFSELQSKVKYDCEYGGIGEYAYELYEMLDLELKYKEGK